MPIDERPPDPRYRDPATARLPHVRYDDPVHNPIAFLPTGEGRIGYEGHVDYFDPRRGEDDDLVEATDNSLRPDDLAFEQPPQNPEWQP